MISNFWFYVTFQDPFLWFQRHQTCQINVNDTASFEVKILLSTKLIEYQCKVSWVSMKPLHWVVSCYLATENFLCFAIKLSRRNGTGSTFYETWNTEYFCPIETLVSCANGRKWPLSLLSTYRDWYVQKRNATVSSILLVNAFVVIVFTLFYNYGSIKIVTSIVLPVRFISILSFSQMPWNFQRKKCFTSCFALSDTRFFEHRIKNAKWKTYKICTYL